MKKISIPYGKQSIEESDIDAVCEVLRSDWLTTGPNVTAFEHALAEYVGTRHGVAVSSGTAALHCAMYALGVGPGDEVIVPAMTFAATANVIVYQGATPVFADIDPDTLLIDPKGIKGLITPRTKAIIAVDFAGQPCDYNSLRKLADQHNLYLVADACHALGAEYQGRKVGSLADITVFSFHPVKHITTGEGGMAVTVRNDFAQKMRKFRNHGIATDFREREEKGSWYYEMQDLGFNYRLTDLQSALGISQLSRLPHFLARRQEIAKIYDEAFISSDDVHPLKLSEDVFHAYHLYVVRLGGRFDNRDLVFQFLRHKGIGVNLHYIPVHLHPYYKKHFCCKPGLCPVTEESYRKIISLPIWPGMTNEHTGKVVAALNEAP